MVYPVNPKRESVQGIQAYKDIPSLPHPPDLAVICTPAATVPGLVRELRRGGHAGHGDHLGRLPRDRRGGPQARTSRSVEEQREVRRHADPRPELPGDHRAGDPPERQFRRRHARQGAHRLHLPVRGPVHLGARLGHRRGDRLLLLRLRGQHARREHGRPDRLLRLGHRDPVDHPVHRVDQRGAGVHVGGPGVCPDQADRGLQGGPVRRIGPGGRLAHRGHGRRGRRVRGGVSAGRHRADLPDRRHVRLRRAAGPAAAAQGRPAGDHHQRRRAGRDDHRRPDRPRRRAGRALRRDDRQAQRVPARRAGRTATRSTCWATPRPTASPRPWRSC